MSHSISKTKKLVCILILFSNSFIFSAVKLSKDSKELWKKAQNYYYRKKYDHAMEYLSELIKKNPNHIKFRLAYSKSLANFLKAQVWIRRSKKIN